jgi:hypothetical protein
MSNVAGHVEIVEILRLPEACSGPSSVAEVNWVSYSVCLWLSTGPRSMLDQGQAKTEGGGGR